MSIKISYPYPYEAFAQIMLQCHLLLLPPEHVLNACIQLLQYEHALKMFKGCFQHVQSMLRTWSKACLEDNTDMWAVDHGEKAIFSAKCLSSSNKTCSSQMISFLLNQLEKVTKDYKNHH